MRYRRSSTVLVLTSSIACQPFALGLQKRAALGRRFSPSVNFMHVLSICTAFVHVCTKIVSYPTSASESKSYVFASERKHVTLLLSNSSNFISRKLQWHQARRHGRSAFVRLGNVAVPTQSLRFHALTFISALSLENRKPRLFNRSRFFLCLKNEPILQRSNAKSYNNHLAF